MITDKAKTVGTELLLIQHINYDESEKGVNIANAMVEAEAMALNRAMAACHHWIYYCKKLSYSAIVRDFLA